MTPNTNSDLPDRAVPLPGTPQAKHQRDIFIHRALVAAALAYLATEAIPSGTPGLLAGIVLALISSFISFKAARRSDFILPAKCRVWVEVVGDWTGLRIRRLSVGHIDPHLLEQISPEMLDQLCKDGLRTATMIMPCVMIGTFSATNWLFGHFSRVQIDGASAVIAFWLVPIGVLLWSFPATLRGHLDCEVKFYSQHGKWRWER